jgi:hypothetical protein
LWLFFLVAVWLGALFWTGQKVDELERAREYANRPRLPAERQERTQAVSPRSIEQANRLAALAQRHPSMMRPNAFQIKPSSPGGKILADILAGDATRDVSLAEALGYALEGEWGNPKHGHALSAFSRALGGIDLPKLLERFTDLAADGKLTIWGKDSEFGVFKKIPAAHWRSDSLILSDTTPAARIERPYYQLMLSRQEIEKEWPHE